MKKILILTFQLIILSTILSLSKGLAQSVGIGTATPNAAALLHVDHGTSTTKGLLITGTFNNASTVPDLGAGSRMMFYPGKAAFRVGYVIGTTWDNSSVGHGSVAMGFNTTASRFSSTALGYNTTASGNYSTALGQSSIASGTSSTALGYNTTASGYSSTAMGEYTTASGTSSTAMGRFTTASGGYSTAIGYLTQAKGFASTVVGLFNDSLLTLDQTFITSTTPLFIVGNGNHTTRSNAFVVRKDGNVGIGVNPSHPLSFTSTLGNKVALFGSGTSHYGIGVQPYLLQLYTDFAGSDIAFGYGNSTAFTENMRIRGNGNATLRGTLTQNSDARLKKDIHQIKNALPLLMQLSGYNYNWKNEKMDDDLQSGVLAQEVQKVFPQLVKEDAEGVLSVNYNGLTPYMIEAIKEQQKQLSVQQEINLEKQKEIDDLKVRIEKLEKLLLKQ